MQKLSPRVYLTYIAHLFKAIFKSYHAELKEIFAPYIKSDAVIIDVGAHAGQFSKLFSKMVKDGHIYAFEPASYTRSILKSVKFFHNLKNVTIVPLGLSDNAGEIVLNIPIKSSGSLGFGLSHIGEIADDTKHQTYKETIKLTTLDNYVEQNKIEKVDFIKADIEGWELRMLEGAKNTMKKFKPTLFLEINDKFLNRAGDSAKDMIKFLQKYDYKIIKLEHDGKKSKSKGKYEHITNINKIDFKDFQTDIICIPKSN